ncbi:MAG: hypothetical protein KGL57_02295 [Burkholderiales bacterium]|nr:hypothetical protein [Burkholderiales bacterium]
MQRLQSSTPSTVSTLQKGELLMPHAPQVRLPSGLDCIPQHYLSYAHTLESVSDLASRVAFDDETLVFATEDDKGLYIQVGLIGRENYDRGSVVRPRKLVYGRKWRIDSDTPTSEIVQTIFLAIQKAREHEVRELLTVQDAQSGAISAPLSCHQDLPLMAQNREWVMGFGADEASQASQIKGLLSKLHFAQRSLHLQSLNFFGGRAWLVITLGDKPAGRDQEGGLAEFDHVALCVTFDPGQAHQLIYEVQDALIHVSDRHVEETFRFDGFARFSRQINPLAIARLSVASRPYQRDSQNKTFYSAFQASNYNVDAGRAPHLGIGALARRNRGVIEGIEGLTGHMPRGLESVQAPLFGTKLQLVE